MSEDSKIPPPDIKPVTLSTPPVTTVDMENTEKITSQPEAIEESSSDSEKSNNGVEADIMKRFLGALLDVIIITGVISLFEKVIGDGLLSAIAIALLWLTRDSLPFLNGQSIGKVVMKTKAIKEDGSSLAGDWKTGAIRNILFIFPIIGVIIEGAVLLTRREGSKAGLRLGDQWAKTKVISLD